MIKILFVCYGSILNNPQKLVKSMVLRKTKRLRHYNYTIFE